jgi:hypothetical protein
MGDEPPGRYPPIERIFRMNALPGYIAPPFLKKGRGIRERERSRREVMRNPSQRLDRLTGLSDEGGQMKSVLKRVGLVSTNVRNAYAVVSHLVISNRAS